MPVGPFNNALGVHCKIGVVIVCVDPTLRAFVRGPRERVVTLVVERLIHRGDGVDPGTPGSECVDVLGKVLCVLENVFDVEYGWYSSKHLRRG